MILEVKHLAIKKFYNLGCHQTLSACIYTYIKIHSDIKYCIILYE